MPLRRIHRTLSIGRAHVGNRPSQVAERLSDVRSEFPSLLIQRRPSGGTWQLVGTSKPLRLPLVAQEESTAIFPPRIRLNKPGLRERKVGHDSVIFPVFRLRSSFPLSFFNGMVYYADEVVLFIPFHQRHLLPFSPAE